MKLLIVMLLAFNLSSAFAGQDTGGGLTQPALPNFSFNYKCVATWIANVDDGPTPVSRAYFNLNNKQPSVNYTKLKWRHGYVTNLNPFQDIDTYNGKGEALKQPVSPSNVSMYFNYSDNTTDLKKPEAYIVKLIVDYRYISTPNVSLKAGTQGPMTDTKLIVVGDIYAETPYYTYTFAVSCEK